MSENCRVLVCSSRSVLYCLLRCRFYDYSRGRMIGYDVVVGMLEMWVFGDCFQLNLSFRVGDCVRMMM